MTAINKNKTERYSLQEIRRVSIKKKVVTIAKHACDHVLKRILKQSTLQIFLIKYEYLRSLQLCEDQAYAESLKETCLQTCVCDSYNLSLDQALKKCIRRLQQLKKTHR